MRQALNLIPLKEGACDAYVFFKHSSSSSIPAIHTLNCTNITTKQSSLRFPRPRPLLLPPHDKTHVDILGKILRCNLKNQKSFEMPVLHGGKMMVS
jgi:hypothetical protein